MSNMYEDFNTDEHDKKDEEDDDSETWSYSYPSYSRFTFTGKTKSRLGRNHSKQFRPKSSREEIKTEDNDNSKLGLESSCQDPKTPSSSVNWLRNEKFPASNPFTPGTDLFLQSKLIQDNHTSVNDSGIDVSSQSNFYSSLKSDVSHNSNYKRNPTFKNAFKPSETHEGSSLKELNNLLKLSSFPKLKFSCEANEENKENSASQRKLDHDVRNRQTSSFDPSWNQLKKICDAGIPYGPITTKNSECGNPISRNQSGKSTVDSLNSKIESFNFFDRVNEQKKDDDVSNTPLDLSSGENLANKNIFSRSIISGSDQTFSSTDTSASFDLLARVPEGQKHKTEVMEKNEDTIKGNSPNTISSILPTFLVPTNKTTFKEPKSIVDESSESLPTVITVANNHIVDLKPSLSNIPQNFAHQPSKNVVTSQFLSSSSQNNDLLKSSFPESHLKKEVQKDFFQRPSYENNIQKETVSFNFSVKEFCKSSYKYPFQSTLTTSESAPDLKMCAKNENKGHFNQPEKINKQITCNTDVPDSLLKNPVDSLFLRNASCIDINQMENNIKPIVNQSDNPKIENEDKLRPTLASKEFLSVQDQSLPVFKTNLNSSLKSSNDHLANLELHNKKEGNASKNVLSPISSFTDDFVSSENNPVPNEPEKNLQVTVQPRPQLASLSQDQKNYYQLNQLSKPYTDQESMQVAKLKNTSKQESVKHQSRIPLNENLANRQESPALNGQSQNIQQPLDFGQQKTFLAPQNPIDRRISNHDFPHIKPEAPQQISSRPNYSAVKKARSNFKMPGPQGLLSRANTELYVNSKEYTILSMLGKGGSSEVYQVLDPGSSKLLAVKCVDLSMVDKTIADGYLNEIDLLSKLQGCASVIKMFDYEYVQEYKMLYVVMEKGDTDLSQLIRDISKTKKISMSMIIYYWTEMLNDVKDIHEQGIIHSDLKPANFLLVSGRLKLIDFGIASSQGDMTSVVKEVTTGTWNYMSPEAIKNTSSSGKGFKITYKSDVWSLGCILYNLVYGKTPFSHITNTWGKLQAIADPNHKIEFPEVGAPVVLAQALRSCFHRDPKQRPTVADLLSLQYHATCDTNHIGRQLLTILPNEWWLKVSFLFPEIQSNQEETAAGMK